MTNLPNSGQSNSMDNTSVTRNEFRTGMNGLLQYLAEALGSKSGYTTEAIASNAVKLNGTPTAPTPAANDNSTKVATTAFVKTAVAGGAVTPGNGAINVNGGNGIEATGSNATANQSSGTTRTLSVKAKTDGGIVVDADGVAVDWSQDPGGGGGVIAYGKVNGNGTKNNEGSGNWEVSRAGTGRYDITFSPALPDTAVIVSTPENALLNGANLTSNTTARIEHKGTNDGYYDRAFSFIVVDAEAPSGGGGTTTSPYSLNKKSVWGVINGTNGTKISGNGYSVSGSGGQYNITFDNPLPDTSYAVIQGIGHDSGTTHSIRVDNSSKTVNGFAIRTGSTTNNSFQSKNEIYFYVLHESMLSGGGDFVASARYQMTSGGATIDWSNNVQSINRSAKGQFDITFETPLDSDEYMVNVTPIDNYTSGSTSGPATCINNISTTGFRITGYGSGGVADGFGILFTVTMV